MEKIIFCFLLSIHLFASDESIMLEEIPDNEENPILIDEENFKSNEDKRFCSWGLWFKTGFCLVGCAFPSIVNLCISLTEPSKDVFYDGFNKNYIFNYNFRDRSRIPVPEGCHNCKLEAIVDHILNDRFYFIYKEDGFDCTSLNRTEIEDFIKNHPHKDHTFNGKDLYSYMDYWTSPPRTVDIYAFTECKRIEQGISSYYGAINEALSGLNGLKNGVLTGVNSLVFLGVVGVPAFYEWWQRRPKI